jgi:CBS domain-containing protein
MARAYSLFGIYSTRESVEEALAGMQRVGIPPAEVATVSAESPTRDLAHVKNTKALEGIAAGALLGTLIAVAVYWLAAQSSAAQAQMPVWLAGADPVLATLAAIGAGSIVGGFIGALLGLGIPEYEARRYRGRLRKKGILLSAHCENRDILKRAKEVLLRTGAEGVGVRAEAKADYRASIPSEEPGTLIRNTVEPRISPDVRSTADQSPEERWRARERESWQPGRTTRERSDHPATATVRQAEDASHTPVREVMNRDVEIVDENTTLSEATDKMRTAKTGFLLVRSEGSIVGVITDRDVAVRATAEGYDPSAATVKSAMTNYFSYCRDDQDIADVAAIMERDHVRRVPVLDNSMRLVGIVSLTDLAARARNTNLEEQVLRLVASEKL